METPRWKSGCSYPDVPLCNLQAAMGKRGRDRSPSSDEERGGRNTSKSSKYKKKVSDELVCRGCLPPRSTSLTLLVRVLTQPLWQPTLPWACVGLLTCMRLYVGRLRIVVVGAATTSCYYIMWDLFSISEASLFSDINISSWDRSNATSTGTWNLVFGTASNWLYNGDQD